MPQFSHLLESGCLNGILIAWSIDATTLGQARASLNEGAYSGGINYRGEFAM